MLACFLCCFSHLVLGFYSSFVRLFAALSPTHPCPVRQVNCGGITLYWPGAAQFKAGGSYPMRHNDLSHCQKWPLALHSVPLEYWGLSPVTHFSCCVIALQQHWSVLSKAQAWARMIWKTNYCPCSGSPLSTSHLRERWGPIQPGTSAVARVARMMLKSAPQGFQLQISPWGLLLKPFPEIRCVRKAAEVWNQGFPPPRWATNQG